MPTSSAGSSSPLPPQQHHIPGTPGGPKGSPPPAAATPPAATSASFEDPTGVWTRFLSMSGTPASPEEVHIFLSTLLKFFSKIVLEQSDQAAKKAAERMKKAIHGDDD